MDRTHHSPDAAALAPLPPLDALVPAAGHPGLVCRSGAAKLLDMSTVGFDLWRRRSATTMRLWRQEHRNPNKPILFAVEDVLALREEMAAPKPPPARYEGPMDAPLPPEGTTVAPGYPGLVTRDAAAALLGIARRTITQWQAQVAPPARKKKHPAVHGGEPAAGFRMRRWGEKTNYGPPNVLFAVEDVHALRRAFESLYAPYSGPADAPLPPEKSVVPAGFPGLVTQREAAEMFGISFGRWIDWQRLGRAPARRWYQKAGSGPRPVLFARADLERLRAELDAYFGPYTGPMDAPLPPGKEAVQAGRPGLATRRQAAEFMGVPFTTWHWWERERTVPGRRWFQRTRIGRGPVVYALEDLAVMKEALRRREEPHPDPDLPGVWRLPIRSHLHDIDALIDEADLPLVRGRAWNWSPPGKDHTGAVVLRTPWGTGTQTPLKRIILGLEGREHRIRYANGNPLDCRRANLIVQNIIEQCHSNRKMRTQHGEPCTSNYKGVCWDEERGKWIAQIRKDGVGRHLGRFDSEEDAARAYDRAARELFSDAAFLNFPGGVPAVRLEARDAAEAARAARPSPLTVIVPAKRGRAAA